MRKAAYFIASITVALFLLCLFILLLHHTVAGLFT